MALVTLPSSPGFIKRGWRLGHSTQVHVSPLTKVTDLKRLGGERWMGTWTFPPVKDRASIGAWEAFFALLEGRANTFKVVPPFRGSPRGTIAGTPVVNGASQTGSTLNIDGVTAGTTLLKADFIEADDTGQLFIVTADVTANGSGEMAVPIKPRIRTSPGDGTTIVTTNPEVEMMSTGDVLGFDVDLHGRHEFVLSAVEFF